MSFLNNIKSVPITDFAERIGYTVVRKGRYYSLAEHDSVVIDTNKNCFWRNSRFSKGYKGGAGSVIDFAVEFNNASDAKEAMRQIAQMYGIEGDGQAKVPFRKPVAEPVEKQKEVKVGEIVLPEKDADNRCVYAYLRHTRGIERSVVRYFFAKRMLYQDTHKNCVFHTGTIFGCVRGTSTEKRFVGDLEGSDYEECFFFRGKKDAETLIVAESVIDIMSVMSKFCRENVRYVDYCYLALAGTNKLNSVFHHIEKAQVEGRGIKKVLIATDNDEAGEIAACKIAEGLDAYNISYERFAPPQGKDWNEYVVLTKELSEELEQS